MANGKVFNSIVATIAKKTGNEAFWRIGSFFSKDFSTIRAALNAWDNNSGFRNSSYGKEYQKALDDYRQKRSDYIKQRGWSDGSLSQGAGVYKRVRHYDGSTRSGRERGVYYTTEEKSRAEVLNGDIGLGPNLTGYYKNWVNAGSPTYTEATDTKVDNTTKDNLGPSTSDSGSSAGNTSAPTKKGYDIQGSSARGHGYSPSSSDDSGEGGTGQRTGDSGDGLGTGTPSGERLKKQFKPLGK